MLTPSIRAKHYSKLSHAEYASWYGQQIGVTSGDLVAAGEKRSLHLIEEAVKALLEPVIEEEVVEPLPEEVFEATSELATPEDIGDSEDFPTELTYDAMTVKELQALCKDRGLPVYGTKAEIALRLKRDAEAAAEESSDAPAEEAAVTTGETNDENSSIEQELIDETE